MKIGSKIKQIVELFNFSQRNPVDMKLWNIDPDAKKRKKKMPFKKPPHCGKNFSDNWVSNGISGNCRSTGPS